MTTVRGDRLFAPIETPFGKLGLFVCYELRFPEVARAERAAGAEILLMPSAWVKGDLKSEHFSTLLRAAAGCRRYLLFARGKPVQQNPYGRECGRGPDGGCDCECRRGRARGSGLFGTEQIVGSS